jgi:hypothetical protein
MVGSERGPGLIVGLRVVARCVILHVELTRLEDDVADLLGGYGQSRRGHYGGVLDPLANVHALQAPSAAAQTIGPTRQ